MPVIDLQSVFFGVAPDIGHRIGHEDTGGNLHHPRSQAHQPGGKGLVLFNMLTVLKRTAYQKGPENLQHSGIVGGFHHRFHHFRSEVLPVYPEHLAVCGFDADLEPIESGRHHVLYDLGSFALGRRIRLAIELEGPDGLKRLYLPAEFIQPFVIGDQRIVADEFLTFPICMIGLPVTLEHWWLVAMAFLTFRICDILKPPPAHQLQRLHGGLGVVADDFFAALYSLGINHGLYLTIRHFLEGDIGF